MILDLNFDFEFIITSSDLSMDSNFMGIVRNDLIQLHCEDVSCERASDKIPLELVRYLFRYLSNISVLCFFLEEIDVCSC